MPKPPKVPKRRTAATLVWCLVLVAGLLVAGSHGVSGTAHSSQALAMVGVDGFTDWFLDGSTKEIGSGTWARGHGVYDIGSSGPDPVGWWAINTSLDPSTVDMARFSWTRGSTSATAIHGDDLFSLADGVVRREVLTDGKNSIIYKGGMLELPAEVHDGSTWESSGTMIVMTNGVPGGSGPYTATGTAATPPEAELAAAGCLDTTLAETYGTAKLSTSRTWCPGRGMVRFAEDNVQHQIGTAPALSYPMASNVLDWSRLSGATAKTTKLAPVGTSLLSPLYASRPGELPDGTVVAGLRTGNDVVAINPTATTGTIDHTLWRAHPGGALLSCVTLGQVTIATTSERRIVAYGPTGLVLWIASSPDSVDQPAITFGGQLIVASVDGTVMALDPSTGHEVWRAKTPSEVAVAPVASGDTMVVIDENGTTVALGTDGHEQWRSTEFPAAAYAISGGVVVVVERGAGTLRGYDVATGKKLWRAWGPSALLSLSDLDGVVVAYLGREGVETFDPATGKLLWGVNEKALDLLVVGNRAVIATTDSVLVVGGDGRLVARIPHGLSRLPQLTVFIAATGSSFDAITTAEMFREGLS